jgi:hypothetical protein
MASSQKITTLPRRWKVSSLCFSFGTPYPKWGPTDLGVAFIGPTSQAITAMGNKIESKKAAKKAGVNVIPGFLGEVHSDEEVLKIGSVFGTPVSFSHL